MPRTYAGKKSSSYSADDLKTALNLIRDDQLTANGASQQISFPILTLHSCLSGLCEAGKSGAKTILSNEEENFPINVYT
jgi:hypothetical protein